MIHRDFTNLVNERLRLMEAEELFILVTHPAVPEPATGNRVQNSDVPDRLPATPETPQTTLAEAAALFLPAAGRQNPPVPSPAYKTRQSNQRRSAESWARLIVCPDAEALSNRKSVGKRIGDNSGPVVGNHHGAVPRESLTAPRMEQPVAWTYFFSFAFSHKGGTQSDREWRNQTDCTAVPNVTSYAVAGSVLESEYLYLKCQSFALAETLSTVSSKLFGPFFRITSFRRHPHDVRPGSF